MCKAVDDYAEKYAKEREDIRAAEIVKNMLKENIPLETALRCAEIDRETFDKYVPVSVYLDKVNLDDFPVILHWVYEYYQSHAGEHIYLNDAIDEYVKEKIKSEGKTGCITNVEIESMTETVKKILRNGLFKSTNMYNL